MLKSLSLLITCVIFCTSALSSQIEFGALGTTYSYLGEYQINNEGAFFPYTLSVEVISDTVINGQNCKKAAISNGLNWSCGEAANNLIYFFEEDSKVYRFNTIVDQFELLYDFTKNEGESYVVPAFCNEAALNCPIDTLTFNIDSISYVEIGGITIKVQHVQVESIDIGTKRFQVYEGIGCLEHFLYVKQSYCTTAHDYIRQLRCFNSIATGTLEFFNDAGNCDTPVQLIERDLTTEIEVYPNPFNNKLVISYEGTFSLELIDSYGRMLLSSTNNTREVSLETLNLPAGLYFTKLTIGNSTVVRKLIKE